MELRSKGNPSETPITRHSIICHKKMHRTAGISVARFQIIDIFY